MLRIAPLQRGDRVDRIARLFQLLESVGADPPAADALRRRKARLEGRHVLRSFLQRIAGRYQKPDLVQAERPHGMLADAPVTAMRGIERTAEKADARHALS